MSIESSITVGTVVVVKVGRNEVKVTVTEITAHGWKVRSQSTGREFEVRHIERVVEEPVAEPEAAEPETAASAASEAAPEEDETPNPAPESGTAPRPEKKLSLINAAAQVLAACREPMNCKEIIAKAVEMELWVPTGGKTPEQTLYSGIFREMKTSNEPRVRKSEVKGKFLLG